MQLNYRNIPLVLGRKLCIGTIFYVPGINIWQRKSVYGQYFTCRESIFCSGKASIGTILHVMNLYLTEKKHPWIHEHYFMCLESIFDREKASMGTIFELWIYIWPRKIVRWPYFTCWSSAIYMELGGSRGILSPPPARWSPGWPRVLRYFEGQMALKC